MIQCPTCKGLGNPDAKVCTTCLGWGVLVSLIGPCHHCKGEKCTYCKNTGKTIDPIPFVETDPITISGDAVRSAVAILNAGQGFSEDVEDDYLAASLAATLLTQSDTEVREHGDTRRLWLLHALQADSFVVDPTGIWAEIAGIGVRIHAFP